MARAPARSRARSLDDALEYLERHGARVEYRPRFLASDEADHYFRELLDNLEFNSDEESMVRLPFSSKKIAIPRRQTAHGDPGTTYTFSGCVVPARSWTPVLTELRQILRERLGVDPNFVLVNHYRSGSDCIGWHADDEHDLGPTPEIVSLTLGAERDFQLRHKDAFSRGGRPATRPDLETITIPLAHGSLLTLRHPTNRNWKHQLPRRGGKRAAEIGDRLNLTWRRIVTATVEVESEDAERANRRGGEGARGRI